MPPQDGLGSRSGESGVGFGGGAQGASKGHLSLCLYAPMFQCSFNVVSGVEVGV